MNPLTERCEMIECTNVYGKHNQCYAQGSETFQDKYYCDEHLEKVKADYEYEQAIKCDRITPEYVKYTYNKLIRVIDSDIRCKKVATSMYNMQHYCNDCLFFVMNPDKCEKQGCNNDKAVNENYCDSCVKVGGITYEDLHCEE